MKEHKGGYEGKVRNVGCQEVKAPFTHDKKDNAVIHRGKDLRQNAGGKKA